MRKAKLFWKLSDWQGARANNIPSHGFVGTVEIPDELTGVAAAEFVWQKANTIDHPWWENKESSLAPGLSRARSMMIGDLVVIDDEVWRSRASVWVLDSRSRSLARVGFERADDINVEELV